MLKRYDLIIDINYPDDAALLYPNTGGKWVEYNEAAERISFLVEALINLKNCNVRMNTPEQLNLYVNSVLEGYR